MKKHSKRLLNLKKSITEDKYSLDASISLLKQLGSAKFIESVEAHFYLNIDKKNINQQIRTNVILPHGTGKALKIALFSESIDNTDILDNDVSIISMENIIEQIKLAKFNFNLLITTPQDILKLSKFGKILGPKGLMPSLKAGTVTQNVHETIKLFKLGRIDYQINKFGTLHILFGKINFSETQLKENLITIYNSIIKNKSISSKMNCCKSLKICSTMSPSIEIDLKSLKNQ